MNHKLTISGLTSLAALGGLAAIVACSDPPPPSLAHVGIDRVYDSTNKTSITYVYADVANCRNQEGSVEKGISIGDGITVALSFTRTIRDLPDDDKQAKALVDKAYTFTVTGDAFTISKAKEADRVIINSVHTGDGTLVISVDGATGSFTMPVHIVEQSAVPPNASTTAGCVAVVPEAGTSNTDAGTGAETSTDTDAGDSGAP